MQNIRYYFVQDSIFQWSFYNKNHTLCGTICKVHEGYYVSHAPFNKTSVLIETDDFSFVQNLVLSNPVYTS